MEMDDEGNLIVTRPKISGKIKLTYNEDKVTEQQMEVDADAYMSELRGQVGVVPLLSLIFFCKLDAGVFFSPIVNFFTRTQGVLRATSSVDASVTTPKAWDSSVRDYKRGDDR